MAGGILGLAAKLPMPKGEEDGEEDMGGSMGEMAAEDFLSAVKSGDAKGVYSAFEKMMRACSMKSDSPLMDAAEDEENTGY